MRYEGMFRRRWKRLLITFSVFGILFGGTAALLHSTAFHRHLLGVLKKSTGWDIRISNSHFNFHRAKFSFDFVEVLDPKGKFKLTCDRVFLDFSMVNLLRGRLAVTGLQLNQAALYLEKDSSIPKPPLTLKKLTDIFSKIHDSFWLQNISVHGVVLSDVKMEIEDIAKQETREGAAAKIELGVAPNFLREIEIEAKITDSSGIIPKAQQIEAKAALKKKGIRVSEFLLDTGKLTLHAEADWNDYLDKGNLEAEGKLEVPNVLTDPVNVTLKAKVEEKKAQIQKIDAHLGDGHLVGEGEVRFPDSLKALQYNIGFNVTDLPLQNIFAGINSVVLAPAKGIAKLEGRAEGTLPELQINANATIENLEHGPIRSRRVDGTVKFHWPELDFEADIKPGSTGRLEGHAAGGVIFKPLPPYKSRKTMLKTLDVSIKEGTLADILPTLEVTGKADATLHLQGKPGTTSSEGTAHAVITEGSWFLGPVDSLETDITFTPDGNIHFSKTTLKDPRIAQIVWPDDLLLNPEEGIAYFEGKPMSGLTVKGSYDTHQEIFKIDTFTLNHAGANLTGTLFHSKREVAGNLRGSIDLASLTLFPRYLREGRGQAKLDVTLSGTGQNPIYKGFLEFSHNELSIRGYSSITDLTGRLSIDGNTLSPHLSGYLGDGKFTLGGSMTLEQWNPKDFNLTFEGRDLHYAKSNAYRIDLDANVTLKGSKPNPTLAGRIDIVNLLYTKPFVLRELVLKPFEETPEESGWEDLLKPIQLNLAIKNSGDLEIKNNISHIFLIANLTVDGTYETPIVRGAINTTEGEMRIFSHDFIITEGRLDFIDPSKREPYLTLHTELDLPPEYTVFAEVKGFLSNLEVVLTSTPSLSREDIISVITTGLTAEEIRQSGRGRASAGQSVLAGEISSILDQPIKSKTGLDVFRLEASESGTLSKLSVGKNLTDRLAVEFQSDFAPQTAEQRVQANYYLTDNILLKGSRAWETRTASTTPTYKMNASFRLRLD